MNVPRTTPIQRQRTAAAALVALLFSWVLGASHLANHHGGDHLHGHVDPVGTVLGGSDHGHDHSDRGPRVRATTPEHDCAVVDLWSNLGGWSPTARVVVDGSAQVRSASVLPRDAQATASVPLHLLAPKNSPPARAARVLG